MYISAKKFITARVMTTEREAIVWEIQAPQIHRTHAFSNNEQQAALLSLVLCFDCISFSTASADWGTPYACLLKIFPATYVLSEPHRRGKTLLCDLTLSSLWPTDNSLKGFWSNPKPGHKLGQMDRQKRGVRLIEWPSGEGLPLIGAVNHLQFRSDFHWHENQAIVEWWGVGKVPDKLIKCCHSLTAGGPPGLLGQQMQKRVQINSKSVNIVFSHNRRGKREMKGRASQ